MGKPTNGIIYVCLTNTDAPGYGDRDPKKVFQSAAHTFFVSTDGMLEKETKALLKPLSVMLAEKWQKQYSVVLGIVRLKIGIAICPPQHHSTPLHTPSTHILTHLKIIMELCVSEKDYWKHRLLLLRIKKNVLSKRG